MTHEQLLKLIRQRIQQAGSLRKLAFQWNVSAALLSRVLAKQVNPGEKILDNLDLVRIRTVKYVRK